MKKNLYWLVPCFIIISIIAAAWIISNLIVKVVVTPDVDPYIGFYLEFMILVGINFPTWFGAMILAGVFASMIDNRENKEEEEDEEFQSYDGRRASAHSSRRVSRQRSKRVS